MHFFANIPDFPPSCALLSDAAEPHTAVVFVHGFGGDPTETWTHFQTLIDTTPAEVSHWRPCDLYFYGYRSVGDPIELSAQRLFEFLHQVFPHPNSDWIEHLLDQHPDRVFLELERVCLREGPSRYSTLILIGHSEGGLILRSTIAEVVKEFHQQNEKHLRNQPSGNPGALAAQIRAEGQAKGWTQSQISAVITRRISMLAGSVAPSAPAIAEAKLRLFAPAIMGARPSRLLGWLDASVIGRVLRPYFHADGADRLRQPDKPPKTRGLTQRPLIPASYQARCSARALQIRRHRRRLVHTVDQRVQATCR